MNLLVFFSAGRFILSDPVITYTVAYLHLWVIFHYFSVILCSGQNPKSRIVAVVLWFPFKRNRFLLAGACVCCVRMETGLKCTSIHYSVTSWLRHAYNAKIIIILAGRKESCAILAVYLVCYRLLVACVVSDAQQIRRMSLYCTRSALHIGMMVLHNDIPVQE